MMPPHLAYLASAGSGKTFCLAHRIIHLLALGVDPGAICALTFSRKAAGEIYESVIQYLVESAEDEDRAARMAAYLGWPELTQDAFRKCLRTFLDGMHRSRIGTIDSFIHGVIQAFSCELGIGPSFQAMDGGSWEAKQQRLEVLNRLLSPGSGPEEEAKQVFVEAFRQATIGKATKGFLGKVSQLVENFQSVYQAVPEECRWSARAIWPQGFPIEVVADVRMEEAIQTLQNWATTQSDADKLCPVLDETLGAVRDFAWGGVWPGKKTPFKNAMEKYSSLDAGAADFPVARRKRTFEGALADAWIALIHRALGMELERHVHITAGIFKILRQFEQDYQAMMRATGRMTFDDLARLLAGENATGLTSEPGASGRLFIDYRLDARIQHWLLDEFQDTSDAQWAVLGNLVDEVMQDSSGTRRFFCVGDIKQAIYGWRGGNASLFRRLLERYSPELEERSLLQSYRSCPVIVDAVNQLFRDIAFGEAIPKVVNDRWGELWKEHCVAEPRRGEKGCVAVVDVPLEERRTRQNVLTAVMPSVCDVLRQLVPHKRGLSCAMLLRSNDEALQVVEYLRQNLPEVPVLLEGESSLMDCPAILLLLAVLREAFHPVDAVADGMIRMSPLRGVLSPGEVRKEFSLRGAFGAMNRIWQALMECSPPDDFARFKISVLLDLAEEFDAGGGGTADAFEAKVRDFSFADQSVSGAVRVMTMHKSKGLGFDAVLLPGLGCTRIYSAWGGEKLLQGKKSERADWVLHRPNSAVCSLEPTLARAVEWEKEEDIFESVCLFYVAVTRAKRGLYLFTASDPQEDFTHWGGYVLKKLNNVSPKGNAPEPLAGGGILSKIHGEWNWFEGFAERIPEPVMHQKWAPPAHFLSAEVNLLAEIEPSATENMEQRGDRLLNPESGRALDFGSHIHALFEQVEWMEDADPEALLEKWREMTGPDEAMDQHVTAQFIRCFDYPDFHRELDRPVDAVELWRERRFEVVLDGQWISGTLDRVHLYRDTAGRVRSVLLLDYKTNRVEGEVEVLRCVRHYTSQMQTYRRALAHMLGLEENQIRALLLFTVPGAVREVKAGA